MNLPRILKAGNDPDCMHREDVTTGNIGTCRYCGRVKDYRPRREKMPASFITSQLLPEMIAGIEKRQRGSADRESAVWAGINATAKRAYRKRGEL